MDISFILLTWNSDEYINGCLRALILEAEQSRLVYEILLVDNGSMDQTVPIIEAYKDAFSEKVHSVYLRRNMGTTYPRNLALRKATGNFICIMDSDVELSRGIIQKLTQAIKNNPAAGMIAPRLVYPNGQLQKSTDAFPTITNKVKRYFFLKLIEKREERQKKRGGIFPVEYAISAMWVIKRAALSRVGLLDENFFYAPEDVDYCLRMWQAGYRILYHADAVAVHHTQEISRGFRINGATLNHIKGLAYYFIKHRYFLKSPIFFF